MNIKLPLLLGALVTAALPAAADDFGIWSEATLQKSLGKKFSIDGGIEFRAEDKVSQPVRWAASIGAGYKPCKYISFGIGYVFIHDYNFTETETDYKKKLDAQGNPIFNGYNVDHAFWRNKHRATFDITGKAEAGRFTFSVRERYQYTHYNKAYTLRDKYRDPLPGNMNPDNWTGDLYPFNGQHFTDFSCDENDKKPKTSIICVRASKWSTTSITVRFRLMCRTNSAITLPTAWTSKNALTGGHRMENHQKAPTRCGLYL